MFISVIGGLGLFLLGMMLLSEGLRNAAGRAQRHIIARFANTPVSGVVTGAVSTAIVQSSTATSLVTIGLVNAGTMSFEQSMGVMLGANIGSTMTGWLVLLLGIKLHFSAVVLPVIAAGATLRLFGRGRWVYLGTALAGFGLVFVGIDYLRSGMESLQGVVTPDVFPQDSILSRLMLVGLGVLITLITHSSAAGMAMALAALFAGRINFTQAACLAIGFDFGTTATAAMAAIGGTVSAKRTAALHVTFNLFSAIAAFALLLPAYVFMLEHWTSGGVSANAEMYLVAFHSAFNVLGVLVALPLIHRLAALIERLVPERDVDPTRHLARALIRAPDESLDMAVRALEESAQHLIASLERGVAQARLGSERLEEMEAFERWDARIGDYLGDLGAGDGDAERLKRHVAALHATDHFGRLIENLREEVLSAPVLGEPALADAQAQEAFALFSAALGVARQLRPAPKARPAEKTSVTQLAELSSALTAHRRALRARLLERVARKEMEPGRADQVLELVHGLDRTVYHLWRFHVYLQVAENNHTTV